MGVGRTFPRGPIADLFRGSYKDVSRRGAISGEISYFLLETRKQPF